MEMSTGASSTFEFELVVSEMTREFFLFVFAAIGWWYFEGVRNRLCKSLTSWNFSRRTMPTDLTVKQLKCSEDEDAKSEASLSEHEPEAELCPTQKIGQMLPAPIEIMSPAVLESADVSEPESQDKIDGSHATVGSFVAPPGLQLPPVFFPPPGLKLAGLRSLPRPQLPEREKASKRKTSNSNPKPQPEATMREIGRCVCWKDCFGFIVDESGARLFVRQTDIEGEKALLAGQVVWFRRAIPQARQTTKALDVALVEIEMAKMLRAAEKDGISWSTFRKAVIDGDSEAVASLKSSQNFASHNGCQKGKLASFKAEATKGINDKAEATKGINDKTKGSHDSRATVKVSKEAMATVASKGAMATAAADVDLKAFLGSGSVEEMRASLKYAPQWVTDKFNSQHGLAA